jgi:hypothetical protein
MDASREPVLRIRQNGLTTRERMIIRPYRRRRFEGFRWCGAPPPPGRASAPCLANQCDVTNWKRAALRALIGETQPPHSTRLLRTRDFIAEFGEAGAELFY